MQLNSCYDWGQEIVKKLKLSWPWKSDGIHYGYIPRGVVLLDDIEKKVIFNEECMGVCYLLPSVAIFDYPESHHC